MHSRPVATILKELQLARVAFQILNSLGLPADEVEFKARQLWCEMRGVKLERSTEGEEVAIVDLERYLDRPELTPEDLANVTDFLGCGDKGGDG